MLINGLIFSDVYLQREQNSLIDSLIRKIKQRQSTCGRKQYKTLTYVHSLGFLYTNPFLYSRQEVVVTDGNLI